MDSFFTAARGHNDGPYHPGDAVYVSPPPGQVLWPVQRDHDTQQPEHPEYCIESPQPAGPQYGIFCETQWPAQAYTGDMLYHSVETPLQPYWHHAGPFEDAPIHPPPLGSSAQTYAYVAEPLPVRELSQQQDSFRPERSSSLWGALNLRAGSDLLPSTNLAVKLQKTIPKPLLIPSASSPHETSEMSPLTPHEPSSTTSSTKPSISSPSSRSRSRATGKRASTTVSAGVGPERKAALLACHFCRGRKIACGGPLTPEAEDKCCNQCSRRKIPCSYPVDSHRGVRRGSEKRNNSTNNQNSSTGVVPNPVGSD